MKTAHWLSHYRPGRRSEMPWSAVWSDPIAPHAGDLSEPLPDAIAELLFHDHSDVSCFAVLDAATLTNLPEYLAQSGLEHGCLFKGQAAEDLADVAPWIVKLLPDAPFTKHLMTEGDAPWHSWGKPFGIFVLSARPFDDVRRHLRRFTRLQRPDANVWMMFRFWQADILAALALHGPFDLVQQLFDPSVFRQALLPCGERLLSVPPDPARQSALRAPHLDPATVAAMGHYVDARYFHDLRQECLETGEAPETHVDFVLAELRRLGFTGRGTIRRLALWWCTRQGAQAMKIDAVGRELLATTGMADEIRCDRLFNLVEDLAARAEKVARRAAG